MMDCASTCSLMSTCSLTPFTSPPPYCRNACCSTLVFACSTHCSTSCLLFQFAVDRSHALLEALVANSMYGVLLELLHGRHAASCVLPLLAALVHGHHVLPFILDVLRVLVQRVGYRREVHDLRE